MKILVVEDDSITRLAVKSQLENPGTEIPVGGTAHIVSAVASRSEAEGALERESFDYAFIDLKLQQDRTAGRELLRYIVKSHPATICIMMTSNNADEAVEESLRLGAAEYIIKPFEARIVHDIMRKARVVQRLRRQNLALKLQAGKNAIEPTWLSTKSARFQEVLDQAKRLRGKQNLAVFISGESGTGKEVLARYLWTLEEDESRVFVSLHCGAIPENLVESELFGYRKGAFSGANENKIGKFEAADGGDIFLDEIATMPLEAQAKLLRVIQEKEVVPLGSGKQPPKKVDVRIISATNENLHELVQAKRFRDDLFYRLKMVTLGLPPLRDRMEDLEDLVTHFLRKCCNGHKRLSEEAWRFCRDYRWPGNIRELENAITVAAELSEGDEISVSDIRSNLEVLSDSPAVSGDSHSAHGPGPYGLSDDEIQGHFNALTDGFEQALIRYALEKKRSAMEAARFLGISRGKLNHKRRTWGWSQLD